MFYALCTGLTGLEMSEQALDYPRTQALRLSLFPVPLRASYKARIPLVVMEI